MVILAVDAGSPGHREAEHLALTTLGVLGLAAPDLAVSTHAVRIGVPHAAFTVSWRGAAIAVHRVGRALPAGAAAVVSADGTAAPAATGEGPAVDGTLVALALRALGRDGRLVRFPGCERLRGTLTVGPAVDGALVGGGVLAPETLLDTRDWVRPVWCDGAVVLPVERVAGGAVAPAEKRSQRACCAAH